MATENEEYCTSGLDDSRDNGSSVFICVQSSGMLGTPRCQYLRRRFDPLPCAARRAKLHCHERLRSSRMGQSKTARKPARACALRVSFILRAKVRSERAAQPFTRPVVELQGRRGSRWRRLLLRVRLMTAPLGLFLLRDVDLMSRAAIFISTIAVAGALGCGGRERGSAGTSSGTGASSGLEASMVSDARVPLYHRASHAICPSQRGVGGPGLQPICPTPPPPTTVCCFSDSQCDGGANGRCLNLGHAGQQCTYDECSADSNCPIGAPCICRSSPTDNTANACESGGNCVVDSDCGGRYCSPSPVPTAEECGGASPYSFPYYCHTTSDTCVDDSDCFVDGGPSGYCVYDPHAKHWGCSPSPGCPP